MQEQVKCYVKACCACQLNKRKTQKYGHLTPKTAETEIWDKMCINLIGPYTICQKGQPYLECKCVTMIDPASGWFKSQQYENKRAITVANIAEQDWFARYPWLAQVVFDRGNEFLGKDFREKLDHDYGIKRKPITIKNPLANAIIERIHQITANMVRTFELETNYLGVDNPWKGILSTAVFAVRSTYHTTLRMTPGQLVFGRDMIFNTTHIANWELICQNKQKLIDANNKRENAKSVKHNYKVGNKVLLKKGTKNKYKSPYKGPYDILQVNDNGTVRMKVGAVEDMYNIHCLHPLDHADASDHGGECNISTQTRRSDRLKSAKRKDRK